MNIVFLGLTISSSWGNGHATTYRGLVEELGIMGHEVFFLEHDKPWYRNTRDFDRGSTYQLLFYSSTEELMHRHQNLVENADLVIMGSYLPEGVQVIDWVLGYAKGVTAFYDIDTPITLESLDNGLEEYLSQKQIPQFDMYLSFSGGEVLDLLENVYGAKKAKAFYCSVDPNQYYPINQEKKWEMGYLGTYSQDRQPTVEELLLNTANILKEKKFVIAGPGYPDTESWPNNVHVIDHLPPQEHRAFYGSQRFTLNVTRQAMKRLGYSPSVRLFEAASCGVPIISDDWKGLSDLFEAGKEIFISRSTEETIAIIQETSEEQLQKVGEAARLKIMNAHTSTHRALELISYYLEIKGHKQHSVSHKRITGR